MKVICCGKAEQSSNQGMAVELMRAVPGSARDSPCDLGQVN